jgi:hypothetical protein
MQTFERRMEPRIARRDRCTARAFTVAAACLALACSGSETPAPGAQPATAAGQGAPAAAGGAGAPAAGASVGGAGTGAGASAGRASGGAGGGAGVPAGAAGSSGAAGAPTTPAPDAGPAPMIDAGMMGDGAMEPAPSMGATLPPVDDPGAKGTFEIQVVESLPGLTTHILIAPRELGRDGIKHPVLVWINGAGANSSSYRNMHDNLAAQGFAIVDDKQSTFEAIPEIDSQRAAIDWVIAQTKDSSSPYHGKFDDTRIAIGGHSLGSVASFGNVADMRITTSVHMAGGVTGNPGGVDNALIKTLRVPTLFLCGSADSNGLGRVRMDFSSAPPTVPLFFGTLAGVGHTDEFSGQNGGRWGRIVAAWLRWRLAGEASAGALFMGDACEFCKGDWTAMKRGL